MMLRRKMMLILLAGIMLFGFVGCEGDKPSGLENPTASAGVSMNPNTNGNQTADTTTAKPNAQTTKSPSPTKTPVATTPVAGGTLYQLVDGGVKGESRVGQMNSYVIHTDNNKLMIFDGGYGRNLADLVKLAQELTGQTVPVVDAWFLSHVHGDHVNAFIELMNASTPAMTVKKVYSCLPTRKYVEFHDGLEVYDALVAALEKLPAGVSVTVKEDDVITVDGLKVEVLLTVDEKASVLQGGVAINESSTIFRLTIGGQRVLFLGDAYQTSGSRLRAKYRKNLDGLQAEVVQMAHHGSQGVQKELYKIIAPKACLWPTPDWLWENDSGEGYNTGNWETITLNTYLTNICGVKHHYVAKDGMQKLVFPLDFS